MKNAGRERAIIRRGALCGVVGVAAAVILYFIYEQMFRPDPYNVMDLLYLPIAAAFGGVAGVLIAVLYVSNKS